MLQNGYKHGNANHAAWPERYVQDRTEEAIRAGLDAAQAEARKHRIGTPEEKAASQRAGALVREENSIAATARAEQQAIEESKWNEVCPECKVHRGHRASCLRQHASVQEAEADHSLAAYERFLRSKVCVSQDFGFAVDPEEIHPWLKPHAKVAVQWAVRGGRRALFENFGLTKTVQQLEIIRLILKRTGGRGLIVMPLGVRQEFEHDAKQIDLPVKFIRSIDEASDTGVYLTNYETIRDGKIDPAKFQAISLDEAAILRGFGGVKTFREFMRLCENVPYRFVATATPDPNEYLELLAYSAFLGIMTVSEGKTRFFKRDSTKADHLTLHPHKEKEFWLWCATWALFLHKPSDLGEEFSDEGYALPPLNIVYHEIPVDQSESTPEPSGQKRMYRGGLKGIVHAAREKRNTLAERIAKAKEIVESSPDAHFILWHDLEDERRAIERQIPSAVSVYGAQRATESGRAELESAISGFASGAVQNIAAKPEMFGAGVNWQRHCHTAIFCGIGFKYADFIQAVHRIYRFLQNEPVTIHLIYAETEKPIIENLLTKWENHKKQTAHMSDVIREYGLSQLAIGQALARSIGCERKATRGRNFTLVHNDSVVECHRETGRVADNSVGLILSSIPFSTMYEYSPSYNDFGHTDSNEHFWEQMDFLIPQLHRVLMPGRLAIIHVKDRIVPGGITGLGFQTVYPFHMDCARAFVKHGFGYLGMKTIVTDVVRENNQTYRLGWTEQCKDGSKMGVGMPEYLLYFRKPPSDNSNSYADEPVVKSKADYTRSRWQIDAHGFMRSSGDRLLGPEDFAGLKHDEIFKLYRKFSFERVYNFEHHVSLCESLERCRECGHIHTGRKSCGTCECTVNGGILPTTFMLLQPQSWHPDVWTDVARMRTLNTTQAVKGKEQHLCPMPLDIANRVIAQLSNPGDVVLDPFAGIGTVPMCALKLGRKAIGVELGARYFEDAVGYCAAVEKEIEIPTLFDLTEAQPDEGDVAEALTA